ncbi:MAG TPA: hypothetical protein RMH99_19260 [Sandaracinaceae bacterium LLY-WYZ-13_1]|nr:hypothetical protein [Sandaracinaceae bacterium LLY-WYZ-13_1]
MRLALMCALAGAFVVTGCDGDDEDPDSGMMMMGDEDSGMMMMEEDAFVPPGSPICDEEALSDEQADHLGDVESERLDDDLGFDEMARLTDAAVNNTFDTDPMIPAGSGDITDPDYMPGAALAGATPEFNSHAPSGWGDTSVTFAGALEMGGDDWTDGWTDFPTDGGADCDPSSGTTVDSDVTTDTTWSGCVVMQGKIFVTDGATLTIDPGTIVLGEDAAGDAAALLVTRGSQLQANGTATDPIVFTSAVPTGSRATGDWAGVALLGASTTNDGECTGSAADCSDGFLQDRIEGIDPSDDRGLYGGTEEDSSCGSLQYVRIEYAGREFSPDNELNGLTLGACGSGTTLSYIQVHRGKDDGIEFFGGTASLDHIVISGASDDSLDFDEGWRGNGQFIIIHQFDGIGDRGIESDNLGANESAEPRTRPNLWNVTMIGGGGHQVAMHREGMQGIMGNFVVTGHEAALDVRASTADPGTSWDDGDFRIRDSYYYDVGDFAQEDLDEAAVCQEAADTYSGAGDWPTAD